MLCADYATNIEADGGNRPVGPPFDCWDILCRYNNRTESGVYTVFPGLGKKRPLRVYCDMKTEGGGWTVRRVYNR